MLTLSGSFIPVEKKKSLHLLCVSPTSGDCVSLVPAPACDPSVTKCPLDLFQSSLKRRGSRETYKEKKTFNQVSRGILLMLQLLERNHLTLNFLKSISIAFKIVKETLPAQKMGTHSNLCGVKMFALNHQLLCFVSRTDKLVASSRKTRRNRLCKTEFGVIEGSLAMLPPGETYSACRVIHTVK